MASASGILDQFSALLLSLYQAARQLPADEFQDAALRAIGEPLRFDASMWGDGTVTADAWTVHSCHLQNRPVEMLNELTEVYLEDLVTARVVRDLGTVVNVHTPTLYAGKRSPRMLDFIDRYDTRNGLVVAQKDEKTDLVQWVGLYRSSSEQQFSKSEQAVVQALYPHLFEALAVNRLAQLDRLYTERQGSRASVAVADFKGVVSTSDGTFEALIRSEFAQWSPGRLPPALMEQLSASGSFRGCSIAVDARRIGQFLFMRARKLSPIDALTAREREVAMLFSKGLSYKQIARMLTLSPHTVRTYLQTAYAKLKIEDKAQLVALVMAYPAPPAIQQVSTVALS